MEHLGVLVIGSPDPLDRAAYFGMLFTETPTYQQLVNGTPKLEPYIELISALSGPNSPLAPPAGIEPAQRRPKRRGLSVSLRGL